MTSTPIGGAALTLLRRIRLAGTPFEVQADEADLASLCNEAGYLRQTSRNVFAITPKGADYLDRLARSY